MAVAFTLQLCWLLSNACALPLWQQCEDMYLLSSCQPVFSPMSLLYLSHLLSLPANSSGQCLHVSSMLVWQALCQRGRTLQEKEGRRRQHERKEGRRTGQAGRDKATRRTGHLAPLAHLLTSSASSHCLCPLSIYL